MKTNRGKTILRAPDFFKSLLIFTATFIPYCFALKVYILSKTFRFLLHRYLSIKHKRQIQFASGLDTIVIRDPDQHQIISQGFLILKGKQNIQFITKRVHDAIFVQDNGTKCCRIPRFNFYVEKCCGFYYWGHVTDLKIQDHVQKFPCDPPKNNAELNQIYGQICSMPLLVNGRSTWVVLVFPLAKNFEGLIGDHYVIFVRINHALADGVSIIRMLSECFLDNPSDLVVPSAYSLVNDVIKKVWLIPLVLFYLPIGILRQMLLIDSNKLIGPPLTGVKLTAFSPAVSLERVKRIKNSTESTVNDVLMSCVAAAFRWYFVSRNLQLPKIRVTIPIAFHDLSAPLEMQNCVSFVTYTVPVNEDTPLGRLMRTKETMRELKNDVSVWRNFYALNNMFNHLPSWLMKLFVNWNRVTAIVSNVPGPQKKCSAMGGQEVVRFGGMIPHSHKTGIGISLLSFNGIIKFAFHVDTAIIAEQKIVDRMANECVKELEAVEKLLVDKL